MKFDCKTVYLTAWTQFKDTHLSTFLLGQAKFQGGEQHNA